MAPTVLGTVVCVIAVPRRGVSTVAETFGDNDSVHDMLSVTDGVITAAPMFGTDGITPKPIAGFIVAVAALALTVDIPSPSVAASAAADMLGIDGGVTLLDVASVGVSEVTDTLGAEDSVHPTPSTITTEGERIVAAMFGIVVMVSAEPSVGLTVTTAAFFGVGCVKPDPIVDDTTATPTLGIVTSVISLNVASVGAAVVIDTFDGAPRVIVSEVAIVGAIVVAATFCGDDNTIVSVSPMVGATVAAATFETVGTILLA